MQHTELIQSSKPKEMKAQSEAFLKGHEDNQNIKIGKNQASYLHRKTKKKVWGAQNKDAQNLAKLSKAIQELSQDHLAKMEPDNDGCLKNFVFVSKNMKQLYQRFYDVILVDSTYRTNKYSLPLLVFAGINENAKTFVLGFAVVRSEEAKNVSWIFEQLFTFLGVEPGIICSDSCSTLSKVIKERLPNSQHLLCAWHVSQNIKKHLSGLSTKFYYFK